LSAFIARLTERQRLTTDSSIRDLRQRVTCQHTVNANESCTYALPGSRRVGSCIRAYEGSSQGAECIGDEHIQLLTHKHSTSYIRTDIHPPPHCVTCLILVYVFVVLV